MTTSQGDKQKKVFIHECGTGNWEVNELKLPFVNRYKKPLFIYPLFEYRKVKPYKDIQKEQLAYFEAIKKQVELIIEGIKKSL